MLHGLFAKGDDQGADEALQLTKIIDAVENGDQTTIQNAKDWLTKFSFTEEQYSRLLYLSASRGHENILGILVEDKKVNPYQPLKFDDHPATTCLHIAAQCGQLACVKLMLDAGVQSSQDAAEQYPIHAAMASKQKDIVLALYRHDKRNLIYGNKQNHNVFSLIAENLTDYNDLLDELLNAMLEKDDKHAFELLGKHPALVSYLLDHISLSQQQLLTQLKIAIANGHLEITKRIVEMLESQHKVGKKQLHQIVVKSNGGERYNLLYYAVQHGNMAIFDYFVKECKFPLFDPINVLNTIELTAIKHGQADAFMQLYVQRQIIPRGAQRLAAIHGHVNVLMKLAALDLRLLARDENNRPLIQWAAKNNRLPAVKYLYSLGQSLKAKTNFGEDALILAILNNAKDVLKWVFEEVKLTVGICEYRAQLWDIDGGQLVTILPYLSGWSDEINRFISEHASKVKSDEHVNQVKEYYENKMAEFLAKFDSLVGQLEQFAEKEKNQPLSEQEEEQRNKLVSDAEDICDSMAELVEQYDDFFLCEGFAFYIDSLIQAASIHVHNNFIEDAVDACLDTLHDPDESRDHAVARIKLADLYLMDEFNLVEEDCPLERQDPFLTNYKGRMKRAIYVLHLLKADESEAAKAIKNYCHKVLAEKIFPEKKEYTSKDWCEKAKKYYLVYSSYKENSNNISMELIQFLLDEIDKLPPTPVVIESEEKQSVIKMGEVKEKEEEKEQGETMAATALYDGSVRLLFTPDDVIAEGNAQDNRIARIFHA